MTTKWNFVFLACATAAIICDAKSVEPKQSGKLPFEFDEVIPNRWGQRGFGGTWISGTEFTYTNNGSFVKYNIESLSNSTVLERDYILTKAWGSSSFRFSSDLKRILVRYAQRQIFRHSTVSKFSILNLDALEQPELKIADGGEIQIAFFSPNGNGLVYIQDNNMYYIDFDTPTQSRPITTDGVPGVIYNGIPDWVYEEEVLGTDAASWFSPEGRKLAFVQFNDENVREAVYDIYGEGERQYPEEVHLRYPKAGTTNPTIALYLVDLTSPSIHHQLAVPTNIVTNDYILGTVFWVNDDNLGVIWLNRRQNRGVFVIYDANTFIMQEIMEINEPNGWIELNTPKCDANAVCYFVNNNNNWPTLTSVDTRNKEDVKHLSIAGQTVLSFYGIRNGVVYYYSTPSADEPYNRQVYYLLSGSLQCLTCDVVTPEGNKCTSASASFSRDMSYYVLSCSGPDPSFTKLVKTDGNTEVLTWEDNADLRLRLVEKDQPKIEFLRVPIESTGFNAVVKIRFPSHINVTANSPIPRYPMLVRVYAGPGSNQVSNSFSIGYQTYQTSKKNIIYVEIDGRGTGNNGNNMMFSVNNKLGTFEMADQIAVTKYLVDKYKFIDPKRVAIWGWSYGGYATSMVLGQDPDMVFKCGISVAPVTSWRFYDTIYTERYMGIDSTADNYKTSDVGTPEHVKNIGKHKFFLIHGNADDNVHYQNSMVLARELEKADIMFDQLSYPNEAHGISGTQRHLYHAMDIFWDKCFLLK